MTVAHPVLAELRAEIDAVDAELVALLHRRFDIVNRVIEIKNREEISAALPDRIEQVVQHALLRAKGTTVPPQAIEKLWRVLISETIAYEERALGKK